MDLLSSLLPIFISLFLLLFGAVVLWSGVKIIYTFYPKTLTLTNREREKDGNPVVKTLSSLIQNQTTELLILQKESRPSTNKDPQSGGNTPDNPADGEEEEGAAEEDTTEKQKTLIEGIATLTSSVKDLLGANFGPAALLVLSGLAILGGGVWMAYMALLA